MRNLRVMSCLAVLASALAAQTTNGTIQASGSATIASQPDQAQFTVSVNTQGTTAQDAAQQNATLATAVINALKAAIGANGSVVTIAYSVSPRYNNASPPAIVGYQASNTVQVTSYNLVTIGSLIDTATQAGGSNVSGISFGLQNPDPVLQQALGLAAKQAMAHAAAIAGGLGAKAGAVISALQGAASTPLPVAAGSVATTTPIETGTVNVTGTVTVMVQLIPQ